MRRVLMTVVAGLLSVDTTAENAKGLHGAHKGINCSSLADRLSNIRCDRICFIGYRFKAKCRRYPAQ